ncbi:hypothetical protein ACA910_009320 [Epithemia clementina (nom. ined.)]
MKCFSHRIKTTNAKTILLVVICVATLTNVFLSVSLSTQEKEKYDLFQIAAFSIAVKNRDLSTINDNGIVSIHHLTLQQQQQSGTRDDQGLSKANNQNIEAKTKVPALSTEIPTTAMKTAIAKLEANVDSTKTLEYTSACTALNSESWLSSARLSNVAMSNDTSMLNDPLSTLFAMFSSNAATKNKEHPILSQSVCPAQSAILNLPQQPEKYHLHLWKMRLIYLSFYVHQHQAAWPEAKLRSSSPACQEQLQTQYQVGSLDYECPTAKFLIADLPNHGFGSVVRTDVVNLLMFGLQTNRTVVFVNNVANEDGSVKYLPWALGSCDRRDFQCFYQPITPCVLTKEDILNATVIVGGAGPVQREEARVVRIRSKSILYPLAEGAIQRLHQIAQSLIQEQEDHLDAGLVETLKQAANQILLDEPGRNSSEYPGGQSSIKQGALLYAMRPQFAKQQELYRLVTKDLPPEFDPSTALGLPIHASDKCGRESECLLFPQYMRLMAQAFHEHNLTNSIHPLDNNTTNILLTSESYHVFDDMKRFVDNATLVQTLLPFVPRFVFNTDDVRQNTGHLRDYLHIGDNVVMSTMSSLVMQLHGRYTYGNCCSNFHSLIFDLLRAGCGISVENKGQCLQQNSNPEFRLCCWPRQAPRCPLERDGALSAYWNSANITFAGLQQQLRQQFYG